MFEIVEKINAIDKVAYKREVSQLRTKLLAIQYQLKDADFPVIVQLAGMDAAGKGDCLRLLNEWLDPRYLRAHAFGPPTEEELQRPPYWSYWMALPCKGKIGIHLSSWYSQPLADYMQGAINDAQLDQQLQQINDFERLLVDDGALIIKVWLHLSEEAQKAQFKALSKDPKNSWRLSDLDKQHLKQYREFSGAAERVLTSTSKPHSPWMVIAAADEHHRNLELGKHLLAAISQRLEQIPSITPVIADVSKAAHHSLLSQLDLTQQLDKKAYKKRLAELQGRLNALSREAVDKKLSTMIVMEGWDAAGKGGVIKRIIPAMDARHYHIIPIAAPTDEEQAHHYLWRFWRHLPRVGQTTFFDRSWYGRVLVERVEGFASPTEWQRAYGEINEFESQLTDFGILLVKFWVHISKDEQLKRFQARENTPYKQHKITAEDYRNRGHWGEYELAVNQMIEHTSTDKAPWILLEGNDKRFARIKALEVLCERLEQRLKKDS